MKKRIIASLLMVLLIFSIAPTAFAADDETPPVLNGITLNAETFNRGDTLTITVNATELESGFDLTKCYINFYCNAEDPENGCTPLYLKLYKTCDGGIQGSVTFDKYVGGTYEIADVLLQDMRGNKNEYREINGELPDISFTLTSDYIAPPVIIPDPGEGPEITSFSLSKRTAHIGDTVRVTLSARGSEEVTDATMQFYPNMVPWQDYIPYDVLMIPVEGRSGTFTGTIKIPEGMPESSYMPHIYLTTNQGKRYLFDLGGNSKALFVINPDYKYINPKLKGFSISAHKVTQGEKLTINATMCEGCSKVVELIFPIYNMKTREYYKSYSIFRQPDGKFSGTISIPFNLRGGNYYIGVPMGFTHDGNGRQVGGTLIAESYLISTVKIGGIRYWYLSGGTFTVAPALTVSGTDNRTILQGEEFDAMQGVTAANYYTGDITGKLTVTGGDFDTNVPGVYLVKYIISDTVTIEGVNNSLTYTDYRWIGVTEVAPEAAAENGEYPLAITDGSMVVGSSGSDVSIKKDGRSILNNGVLTEPGEYTFSNGGDTIARTAGNTVSVMSVGYSGNSVTAVIDRSAPQASTSWRKDAATGIISVLLKAKDISGVSEIKYIQGAQSLETCRDGGTAYIGMFTIPAYGKLTVYTRDGLGNEGIKVIDINKAYSDSAYLWDINISAGALLPEFSKTKYSYKINLAEDEGSVTLTPVKECDAAVMKINGDVRDSITVDVGNNKTKTVTIKVSYGGKTKAYTFVIKRAKSTNNDLASLTATANGANLPFNEPFSPDNLSYSLTLDEFTKSVKISDTAAPYATSSFRSKTYTLKNGETKVICLTVTAQSGARKTYAITVTRDKSTDNKLKSLKTSSRSFALSSAFSPDTAEYTITMPVNKSTFTLYASPAGYKAAVTIDGIKRTSKKITLQAGQSTEVQVKVTAQSGAENIYHIAVHREISTDTSLKYLKTSSSIFMLSPVFSPDVAEYTITMPASKGTFTLYAGSAGYGSSVAIDGVKRTSKKITLSSGQSVTVHVLVTAQSGDTKEYNIIVIRP